MGGSAALLRTGRQEACPGLSGEAGLRSRKVSSCASPLRNGCKPLLKGHTHSHPFLEDKTMNMIRYQPWDLVDHLFNGHGIRFAGEQNAISAWAPRVDVKEEAERFLIRADVPGVD